MRNLTYKEINFLPSDSQEIWHYKDANNELKRERLQNLIGKVSF